MSANGRLRVTELKRVQGTIRLSKPTAAAYKALAAAAKKKGITVSIARPIGGYRSFAVQKDMHVHPAKYNLNPGSSVSIAAAGYSSHGTGTRVDMLFNGSSWPTPTQLDLAERFGFTRQFGAADPNHFEHDGKTAVGK